VVKGFLELMMRQGEAAYSKEQWHFLTSAFESNEQLIEVSKSLLNLARLEGGLIEPNIREFDPNRALQSKIASYAPLYKTKRVSVNLSVSSEENTTAVCNDESFFLEVFGILLGNAIKHSPIGGGINVSCVLSQTQCEVHVIDEGTGIPDAVKASLFKEGQGASEKENSHGLGLYMAKKYIALLGGSIGIEDSDKGSDFYFTIPNVRA
jgi:signal transduction histidine kinase